MDRQTAHLIVSGSSGSFSGTDPLWINGQIGLITSVALFVAEGSTEVEDCHLHAVYRVMVEKGSENEDQGLHALLALLPLDHPGRMAYATYQLAQGKTRASIITTAASSLQLVGDPDVAWVTGEEDHDLDQIGQHPTAARLRHRRGGVPNIAKEWRPLMKISFPGKKRRGRKQPDRLKPARVSRTHTILGRRTA